MPQSFIGKYVDHVVADDHGVSFDLTGMAAVSLPGTPGWLTGEEPLEQGIETTMPNLPRDLHLPALDTVDLKARIRAIGSHAFRLQIAPADHPMWVQPSTWPGILVNDVIDDVRPVVTRDADHVELTLPGCSLLIGLKPFTVALCRDGRLVMRTGERLRQVAGFPMAPPVITDDERITLNLEMAVGEKIFGFGEQFSALVKNGQKFDLIVNDALGTGTGLTYKPVPVWHSTSGYTAFVNTGAVMTADVGHDRPSVLGVTLDDSGLDVLLFAKDTLADRLQDYTALTGRAERPPLWAFGYWMGRCRYHSDDEMLEVGRSMRKHAVPADVLHCDPDWLIVDRLNTDFLWNTERFGNRADFIEALDEDGFKLSLWQVPYIDPASPVFAEAEEGGHLMRMPDGALAELQGTPTPDGRMRALFDVTNPATADWIADKERPFFDDGLAVIKTDFGEGCPPGAQPYDGTPGNYIHNLYTLRYNGLISDTIRRVTGKAPLVWGRSGWAGSQRYPGQWGGDAESTVVGMQATLRGGLSYATCAPGFWSHDIGGFYGPELTPGLYIRWTQLGALSPLMRAHGLRPREPWEFGEEALRVCRDWIRLRYSLLPYLWQVAAEVENRGLPFIRPLFLHAEGDRVALDIDDEFLIGSDLLVAPVFDDGIEPVVRSIYLPKGVWYDFATDERIEGPRFLEREVGIESMPMFVRAGGIIPRVRVDESVRNTADLLSAPWIVHVWGDASPESLEGLEGFDGPAVVERVERHG